MPVILVTNDDGVHSPGLIALLKAMKEVGDAYVVAPDRERSAASHSLTLHRPLKPEELRERVWAVNGTPTDCVAIGVEKILREKPDIIVSGVNKGANLGDDITYSGTVAAAMEGTILGIPSIAVSTVLDGRLPIHFETAARFAAEAARYILDKALPYDTLLNINVPNRAGKDIMGMKFTRQGKRVYSGSIQETFSPAGEKHYWIGGGRPFWEHGEDTDMTAVIEGYISVTPVHLDLTNYEAIEYLKRHWKNQPEF
ncbi:MAG: 5'/3'-nucleotidase SurE [Thermodesulfovibrionales bacterium]|nr:5'/3'-nucleotidase SurE [Thermodesulfovibrionales bacterium]